VANTIPVHDTGAGEGKLALDETIGVHLRRRLVWGLELWALSSCLQFAAFSLSSGMCKGCTPA
jgi:hypothetical protein